MQGRFTGDDDVNFFQPEEDPENAGSIIWTGEGNDQFAGSNDTLICFSGVSSVQVRNNLGLFESKALADLKVGDSIKTTTEGDYERVYAFGHYSPFSQGKFLQIYISGSMKPLEISKEHLIYLHQKWHPVRADAIRVGDKLDSSTQVTKIKVVERQGVFAPLTTSGVIIVDGVKVSSYADIRKRREARALDLSTISEMSSNVYYLHLGMSPFRLYCNLSKNLCLSYNEDGMPPYVVFGIWISNFVSQLPLIAQVFYLAAFSFVTCACTLFEIITAGRFGCIAVVSVYFILQRKRLQMMTEEKGAKSC